MTLADILTVDDVVPGLKATGKKMALQKLCEQAAKETGLNARKVFDAVMERERLGSTGVGAGVAIPHARMEGLTQVKGWFARLDTPIEFDAIDDEPVDLIFLLLAPEQAGADHLKALARVSRLFRREDIRRRLRETHSAAAAYALLADDTDRDAA